LHSFINNFVKIVEIVEIVERIGEKFLDSARVHGRGRIQIPKRVREELRAEDGTQLVFVKLLESGDIIIRNPAKLKGYR